MITPDKKNVICILCPVGCKIRIKKNKSLSIQGAKCNKGIEYSKHEILNPKRILTTSILVKNGILPLVSVKTSKPVPKDKIFKILRVIKKKSVNAPINIGDILIENILDTGSNIVSTKTIEKK
jgi:CxxC motif-containing protein